jgi:N-acetylglucosaminyldiphosphoundecaprenol N-acetyl-beta-D-mannosaminyltransferase
MPETIQTDPTRAAPVDVWGLPLAPYTRTQAVEAAARLIEAARPSFFVTANLHYAMLSHEMPELREVNRRAAFILADGAPLVWGSRRRGTPLPERVTGSDLIYDLAGLCASRGYPLFLMGGAPGVAERAAANLAARSPGLKVAGTFCPPFREPSPQEHREQLDLIRSSGASVLMLASTMPRGEMWICRNLEDLGVPLCVNIGAGLDFAAGRISRAPRWMQRSGLEWSYRLALEPGRLGPRYLRNALFLARMALTGPPADGAGPRGPGPRR